MEKSFGSRARRLACGLATACFGFGVSTANAAEFCNGRVCPDKFECKTEVSSCPPGETGCEPIEDTWCASPECTGDAECPAGMRCVVTEKLCRPRYELPCNTETDCGAGFTCEAVEGASVRYCAFSVTACTLPTASRDCASRWSCVENVDGLCANPGDPHTGCNPGNPEFVCLPPYLEGVAALDANGDDQPAVPPESHEGCSIGHPSNPAPAPALLLAGVLGSLLLARRRSAR